MPEMLSNGKYIKTQRRSLFNGGAFVVKRHYFLAAAAAGAAGCCAIAWQSFAQAVPFES